MTATKYITHARSLPENAPVSLDSHGIQIGRRPSGHSRSSQRVPCAVMLACMISLIAGAGFAGDDLPASVVGSPGHASADGQTVTSATGLEGTFISPMGDAVIGFGFCEPQAEVCGKVIAQTFAPDVEHDILNPDPDQRGNAIIGLTILDGMRQIADDTWKGDRFYDPRTGKTYRAKVKLLDENRVKIWGCIAAGLCKGYVWTRISEGVSADVFM